MPLFLTDLLVHFAKNTILRLQKLNSSIHNKSIPIIVITGTVGKSSATLLISELLRNNDFDVISGTSETKNLNTLAGLVMSLGGFYVELSSGWKIWKWFLFLYKAFGSSIMPKHNFAKPLVIVSEVGYDNQGESKIFERIFENITILVVTAATWEHNGGYTNIFDEQMYIDIKESLPDSWCRIFENKLIDNRLRNIALEQLYLGKNAEYIILPEGIGEITNSILSNAINSSQTIQKIQSSDIIDILSKSTKYYLSEAKSDRINGILVSDKFVYNSKYLLPKSFARNSLILQAIVNGLDLDDETISKTVRETRLPFGRFGQFNGISGTRIIDSSYNSDPASLGYFLDMLEEVIISPDEFGSPKGHSLILGEMRELGDNAVVEHAKILDRVMQISSAYPDEIIEVYLIGDEWLKVGDQNSSSRYINYKGMIWQKFDTPFRINTYLDKHGIVEGSWFWIKGSQNNIFLEVVVKHLLADPIDAEYLCRQESKWDSIRQRLK